MSSLLLSRLSRPFFLRNLNLKDERGDGDDSDFFTAAMLGDSGVEAFLGLALVAGGVPTLPLALRGILFPTGLFLNSAARPAMALP